MQLNILVSVVKPSSLLALFFIYFSCKLFSLAFSMDMCFLAIISSCSITVLVLLCFSIVQRLLCFLLILPRYCALWILSLFSCFFNDWRNFFHFFSLIVLFWFCFFLQLEFLLFYGGILYTICICIQFLTTFIRCIYNFLLFQIMLSLFFVFFSLFSFVYLEPGENIVDVTHKRDTYYLVFPIEFWFRH